MKHVTLIYMPTVTEEGLVAAGDFLHDRTEDRSNTHLQKARIRRSQRPRDGFDRFLLAPSAAERPPRAHGPQARCPAVIRR